MDDNQKHYAQSEGVRCSFRNNLNGAEDYYYNYSSFILKNTKSILGNTLLDVGCGNGWSSYFLSNLGFDVTGIDLNPTAFEVPKKENLVLTEGSALKINFGDCSFDVVSSFQCLEHVPDPEVALTEMIRVCKPGGFIVIVGPNLINPFLGIKYLLSFEGLMKLKFFRDGNMAIHPSGNTFFEVLWFFFVRSFQLLAKMFSKNYRFKFRKPDTKPPFNADNDAVYLCNPIDLVLFFQKKGLKIVSKTKNGRSSFFYFLRGGTWIAAKK